MDLINYSNFEEALRLEGQYATILNGSSMYPMVRHCKDPVLLVPAVKPLKRYDVAVYFKQDKYVVHRVLGFRQGEYIIRGDNCVAKEYIPEDKIVAVVSGFWRNGIFVPASNHLYRTYARIWVAINPLIRAHHFTRRVVRYISKKFRKHIF